MIIMKFGGSSVADAQSMSQALNIVKNNLKSKPIVVLSACKGITDKLILTANTASKGKIDEALEHTESIRLHHFNILQQTLSDEQLTALAFDSINNLINKLNNFLHGIALLKELTPQMLDFCLSTGEMLSSQVFYYMLLSENIDAYWFQSSEIIETDSNFGNAKPNYASLKENASINLLKNLDFHSLAITQGFIAKDKYGQTTTLGRGGSDFSAALLAYAVHADEIQIWTDVSGVLSTDPKLIESAITINYMNSNEIRELSFLGAKVLHPDTIKPAIIAGIPIKVLNTFEPNSSGTTIIDTDVTGNAALHSISVKKNCLAIRISLRVNDSINMQIPDLLNIFYNLNFNILLSSASESSLTIIIDNLSDTQLKSIPIMLDTYNWNSYQGNLICLVGSNLLENPQFMLKITEVSHQYSPKFFLYGNNNETIYIIVDKSNSEKAILDLHQLIIS